VLVSAVLFGPQYRFAHWVLNTEPFRWIGRLSYSLYVWHEGVASFLTVDGFPDWEQAVIRFATAFAVASISYYAVERPFLALRGHFRSIRANKPLEAVARHGH
jgi:peptidoglycan/LPS O-acetylase OafA/YrhL